MKPHYIISKAGSLIRTTDPEGWVGCHELTRKEWMKLKRDESVATLRTFLLPRPEKLYALVDRSKVSLLIVNRGLIRDVTMIASWAIGVEPKFASTDHRIRRRANSMIATDTWELVYMACSLDKGMPSVEVL